ncbi:MAG: hypothetical protein WBG95_10480 [Sulfitobacter sp.]
MTHSAVEQSRETFGFLSPFGDHRIGARADLSGFFALAERVGVPLPVICTDLWRGYVGPEHLDTPQAEMLALSTSLADMSVKAGDLAALGFTPDYLARTARVTPAALCAALLAVIAKCIEEARSELEVFPNNPNHAIRTGSTAIPESMFMRDLPRGAFFREGPPIWLRDRSAASRSREILQ